MGFSDFRLCRPGAAFAIGLGFLIPLQSSASLSGQACPAQIDANDCVANDLQSTGAEVISGPSSCTEGELFSATVRILFDEGGGANTRFNVGFYVGEAGEPAIGGASCTFDSLQPIGDDPNPQGGPYLELNGDQCGDIEKSEPTYKDIHLENLACRDDDGDGNVDISYVFTWTNNGNQADCADPLDPAEFDPAPPKCLNFPEYDLPISVEDPPSIAVGKGASPAVLNEPGGAVRFPITVINTSPSKSDPVTIVGFQDEVDGVITDVTALVNCTVPFVLAPSQSKTCLFVSEIEGVAGDTVTDTITVFGRDDEGRGVEGSDSTTVRIISDAIDPIPGDLRLVKYASPRAIDEPGGTVRYDVLVANLSPTPVDITSLEDDLYGDLNGKGNCTVPQTLAGLNSLYFCAFEEQVSGAPGDVITDTITVTGVDSTPSGTPLSAADSASVLIKDVPSDIQVKKIANPSSIQEPAGFVGFTLRIQNTSTTDVVTVTGLLDSALGVPKGTCTTGFDLRPGEVYECTYPGVVRGNADEFRTNIITVTARDDDGETLIGVDAASVKITGQQPDLGVRKIALPPFLPLAGGTVNYAVAIQNTSSSTDPIKTSSLTDTIGQTEKPLDGVGTCDLTDLVLQPAPGPVSFYICTFPIDHPPGTAGDTVTDTVKVTGVDDEGYLAEASDSATVRYLDVAIPDPVLRVAKIAAPYEITEPGDEVTFSLYIANASDPANPNLALTLNALEDDIYGDLFNKGDCNLLSGDVLQPGDVRSCSFTETVTGAGGDVETDTVTVTAIDVLGRTVQASDSASVTIAKLPSSITVVKTAYPTAVIEPGANVQFSILVYNTSPSDAISLEALNDNVHGELISSGLCPPPPTLFPGRDPYNCVFEAYVGGKPGYEELNTVTALGSDESGDPVDDTAQASVTVLDVPPSIEAFKTAVPDIVPPQGDSVTYTFTARNTSRTDAITLDTLQDSVFGDLSGQGDCVVPQVLQPDKSYSCSIDVFISGNDGATHANELVVTGTSDDGDLVAANAEAIVRIASQAPAIGVRKVALPPFIPLAGGTTRYLVGIQNLSGASDPVTITSLVDEVGGEETSLDGVGTCDLDGLVLQPAPGAASYYACTFTQDLPPGNAGETVTDTVTATGTDDEGSEVAASDSATVTYVAPPELPELDLAKFASPFELPEPGGNVTFSVVITNSSDPDNPDLDLTLTSLDDDIYGDLFEKGDCGALQGAVLEPRASLSCSFSEFVRGAPGDVLTDTIIATAVDARDRTTQATATASVTITDLPASLHISKSANPTSVVEPGDEVTFQVLVTNASQADIIDMESLVDDVHGDLLASGLCPPAVSLFPGRDPYFCEFQALVSGPAGFVENNTVTVTGRDDNDELVSASAQATVVVEAERASIRAFKSADPLFVESADEPVTFTFTVVNSSREAEVTIESLLDSTFGNLDGQGDCTVPQQLPAGASYSCRVVTTLDAVERGDHVNQFVAIGQSERGDLVIASAGAIVLFAPVSDIPLFGPFGLLLLALLLGVLGLARLRNY